jgi:hypothetical protein
MRSNVHYIDLDVHQDSIAVAIAPQNTTEVRRNGVIAGPLEAIVKLLQLLSQPKVELRLGFRYAGKT